MPAPVTIGFAVRGLADVQRAFGGVEAAMVRLERAGGAVAVKGSEDRVKTTEKEVKARESEYAAYAKYLTKTEEMGVKAAASAAEQRERIAEASYRRLERELEAAERRKTAIIERELVRQEQAASNVRRRVASAGGAAVMGGTGRALGGLASMAGAALTIGGGFGIAEAFRGEMAAEKSAANLVNLVTTGGKAPDGATVKNITARAGAVAIESGLEKQQVIDASVAYAKNARGGDFGGVMANMAFFAKAAKVGGVDMSVLAAGAGKLQSQNPDLTADPKKMQETILAAMGMAKSGSVSFEQAIGQVGTLASTRGLFQGDEATNQRKLIGLGQIAASGGESGDMGTYIKNVAYEIGAHRKQTSKQTGLGGKGLEALGVNFDKQGMIESPEQAISAMFKATGGDLTKLHAIVGNRGMPMFTELSKSFNSAGGGDAGADAVKKQMTDMYGATMTSGDLDKRLAETLSTPAERFGKATQQASEILQAHLAPMIERMADKLPAAIETFEHIVDAGGKLAEWFVSNPITGIGALITGSVAKDLAGAAIGAGVKVALENAINGASGGTVGALGKVTTGLGLLSAAIGVTLAGMAAIDAYFASKSATSTANTAGTSGTYADALRDQRAGTKLSPARIAEMQAQLAKAKAAKGKVDAEGNPLDQGVASTVSSIIDKVSGVDSKANRKAESDQLAQTIAALTKALDQNTAATKADTAKPTGGSTGGADRHQGMGARDPGSQNGGATR